MVYYGEGDGTRLPQGFEVPYRPYSIVPFRLLKTVVIGLMYLLIISNILRF
jgi:hypothetical protein